MDTGEFMNKNRNRQLQEEKTLTKREGDKK